MKIVDKYIIKQFVLSFLFMFLLFIPIGILVDVSEKIDKFKEHDLSFYEVFDYYIDFIWYYGYFLFPIFVFLAVIWFTSKLSSNSEVIAILSSGVSFKRYLQPFIVTAIFIAFISIFSGMFIIPEKNKSFTIFQNKYLSKKNKNNALQAVYKQISDNEYIYVSSYNKTRNQAYNFSIEKFNGNELQEKILARNIRWIEKDSLFRLTDYFKRTFKDKSEKIESKRIFDTIMNLTMSDFEIVNYQAKTLNFFENLDSIFSDMTF
mgnify:FL=1